MGRPSPFAPCLYASGAAFLQRSGRTAPDIRRCVMTLLELGMIARRHETDIAHAMLHAVAVCLSEGSWYGWR